MLLAIGEHDRVLVDRAPFVIGRSPSVDLFLSAERISRRQAVIEGGGQVWTIRDAGSTWGVEVDGVRIGEAPHPLSLGARIVMGSFAFRVVALDAELARDEIVGPYARHIRFTCAAITCAIETRLSMPTASAERLADLDADLARGAICVRAQAATTVVEVADALEVVAAARRLCTRAWPELGGAAVEISVGDYTLDAHALARLALPDGAEVWAWLCERTHLTPIEPRTALAGVWRSRLLGEGRLEPPPTMLEAARARGVGLLVWVWNTGSAQLVRVAEPMTLRSRFNADRVDEIELPAALPSTAPGAAARVGYLQSARLTVAG